MATCKHCGDEISGERKCEVCKGKPVLKDQCLVCHDEVAHGQIPKGSVHFCGSSHEGLTPRQKHGLTKTG